MENIAFQHDLRPALPNVYGTLDYREFRETLIKIDNILTKSNVEHDIILNALENHIDQHELASAKFYSSKSFNTFYNKFRHALRCNIARHLTGDSYRSFSIRLVDSTLFQWFTGISAFGSRKAISKSTLERYEKCFDEKMIEEKIRKWMSTLSDPEKALASGLHEAIDCHQVFMDSTCIKSPIHYPVDWLLLRDAVRSLLLTIKSIRRKGLKNRMTDPDILLKQMSNFCIDMTHTRRQKGGKKHRKSILRSMKKLTKCIEKHAMRYRMLLQDEWRKTSWTECEMQQVIGRIDLIVEQIPAAIKQAHDRIIGERQIASSEKILSLYDKDVQVIVRGKSGNEVEFGQCLLLCEQVNGLIIDWDLSEEKAPSDNQLLEPTVERLEKSYGKLTSVTGDRGFSSKVVDRYLEEKNIFNGVCPRNPKQLQENLGDPRFVKLQTRRSQTEARIGIFKNVFLGNPLKSRSTLNKRHAINWCVLTHNLWVLSRKTLSDEKSALKKAA